MVNQAVEMFLHAFAVLVLIFSSIMGIIWIIACVCLLGCVMIFCIGITRVIWKAGSLSKEALLAYSRDESAKL